MCSSPFRPIPPPPPRRSRNAQALWTGATIGHPHDVFEPPDFATTPQLARAMLALGWATTYVVLSYLRAQAGQFGLERRVLLMPSIGALALCFLSLLLLLLV
eukprot:scaffold13166_cov114-Isochrysis_galbana.AAC.9